jgi:Tfp pilus assembly protein FimV
MFVARVKHLFALGLDGERTFVVRWRTPVRTREGSGVAATITVPSRPRPPVAASLEPYVADPRVSPTRRRHRILAVLAGLVAVVWLLAPRVGSAFGSVPASAPERGPDPAVYVVQPGDTLWSIARRVRPEGDIRRLVERLEQANGGARVRIGDRVAVPVSP